jgi:hypothetical protein
MPDFEFYPWEQLWPEISDGEATARVKIDDAEWLFRPYYDMWFVREASKEKREWNFLVRLRIIGIETDGMVRREELDPAKLGSYISNIWEVHPRERVWKIEDMIVVWSEKQGWTLYTQLRHFTDVEQAFPFRLELPSPIEQMPSSAVHSHLQNDWKNPKSDLRFSAHFASLGLEERALYAIETQLDTPHKMAHLLRATMRVFAPQWPAEVSKASLGLEPPHQWPSFLTGRAEQAEDNPQRRYALKDNDFLGLRERAICNRILRIFEPRPIMDLPELPSTVRPLATNRWGDSFSISTPKPSKHEQLEALLELRTWLQAHWPEGVRYLAEAT